MNLRENNFNSFKISASFTSKEEVDFSFKITLIGAEAVGKTSLRKYFIGDGFKKLYLPTIGTDFSMKRVNIDDYEVLFQIWDVAGHSRFKHVRKSYFLGSDAGLFVHDVTRPDTLQFFDKWINEFWQHTGKGPVPLLILSNKMDLKGKIKVDFPKIHQYFKQLNETTQRKYGFETRWLKTSAKNGHNVKEAFISQVQYLISQLRKD